MSNTAYRPLSDSLYVNNEHSNRMERRSSNGLPKRHWQLAKTLSKKRTFLIILILLLPAVYFTWGAVMLPTKETEDNNIASVTAGTNAHPSRNRAGQALMLNILKKQASESKPDQNHSKYYMSMNESVVVCNELLVDSRYYIRNQPQSKYNELPMIYFITPTYSRREQVPDITRLAHTLMHVPRIHWIVADDSLKCNAYLGKLLMQFEIPYTLLCTPMPEGMRKKKFVPRGVSNRRLALQWIRKNNITSGVLYFGDDDNTYDLRLFSEIRETQRVSMLPVGLIQTYSVSGPVVRKGKVVGFLDSWVAKRRWPVDMAGFAVNLAYFAEHPNATMPYKAGHEEDIFLRSIGLHMDMIEPKANNCTEILVWHTQTKHADSPTLKIKHEYLDERSNLGKLLANLKDMGMAYTNETEGLVASLSKNGEIKPFEYFFS